MFVIPAALIPVPKYESWFEYWDFNNVESLTGVYWLELIPPIPQIEKIPNLFEGR